MKSIPEHIDEMIRMMPYIDEMLAEGLINTTALARRLQPELEKRCGREVQVGGIVMAIKRRPTDVFIRQSERIEAFLSKITDITVRSHLIDYTFQQTATLRRQITELLGVLSKDQQAFYAISQGIRETTLVVSRSHASALENLMKNEKLVSRVDGLSAITAVLPTENLNTPGVYYYIFRQIAQRGLNIFEVISTANEFTILVAHHEVEQAFALLNQLGRR